MKPAPPVTNSRMPSRLTAHLSARSRAVALLRADKSARDEGLWTTYDVCRRLGPCWPAMSIARIRPVPAPAQLQPTRRLAALDRSQHGVATRGQVLSAGLTRAALD